LSQGNLDATENATDLAISGDGYFVARGSDGQSFTRDGSLHFDKDGFLITNDNQRIQGFVPDSEGKISSRMEDIHLPKAITPAKATKRIDINANLDSRADVTQTFNAEKPSETSSWATGVEVFDTQGNKHLMTMYFNKTADRQWEWHGMCDGKEVSGGKEGKMAEVAKGRLTFTVDGKLDTQQVQNTNFTFTGGALPNQKIDISFGDAITTNKGKGLKGTVQFGKESDLMAWSQDGSAAGTITNMSFSDQGVLSALYSNGETKDLAQICLAKFDAPERLYKVGNNRFKESHDGGTPAIGVPQQGGRGRIYAKSLERSTVDLAMEFVNLIQNQRGFQANAKTISTSDELLGEIIQLKR
jgi:flagellar hook protein FlgE